MKNLTRPRAVPFKGPPPLTEDERKQFVAILESPVFRKALVLTQTMKPSALFPPKTPTGANDRLFEIRGWEEFENALFLQAEVRKPRGERSTESFPDQGLIDYAK